MRLKLIGIALGALMTTGCAVDVYPVHSYPYVVTPVYTAPVVVHRPYVHHHYTWGPYHRPHWQYRYQRRYWR